MTPGGCHSRSASPGRHTRCLPRRASRLAPQSPCLSGNSWSSTPLPCRAAAWILRREPRANTKTRPQRRRFFERHSAVKEHCVLNARIRRSVEKRSRASLGTTWLRASRDSHHRSRRRGALCVGGSSWLRKWSLCEPRSDWRVRALQSAHSCKNSTNNVDVGQVRLFESRRLGAPVASYRGSRVGFLRFAEKT